jgi:hypothetical protein
VTRLLSVLALAIWTCAAQANARPCDGRSIDVLREQARVVSALQQEFLDSIATAPTRGERFDLYRTYDQSIGTWVQVRYLQAILERAIAASSASDEPRLRAELRDQALYTLWELDQNIAELRVPPSTFRPDDLQRTRKLRSALQKVRAIAGRYSTARPPALR